MNRRFLVALAATSFVVAAPAAAADKPVYAACDYQDRDGNIRLSNLFAISASEVDDGYNGFTYEKTAAWERDFQAPEYTMRPTSSYQPGTFLGVFKEYAASQGDEHSNCWVTTDKARTQLWRNTFNKGSRKVVIDTDWRPKAIKVVAIEDWNGRPVAP